jgi:hypothetical protein
VAAEAAFDHLPAVVPDASLPPPPPAAPAAIVPTTGRRSIFDSTAFALGVLVIGLLPLVALRRRVIVRKMRARSVRGHDESATLVRSSR